MGQALVTLHNVSVYVKDKCLLQDITLSLEKGQMMTIIGPNGAGKTTLLRVLLGLTSISTGTLWRLPNLKIGYMPQSLQVNQGLPLTVKRFLQLKNQKSMDFSLERALDQVGALSLLEKSFHNLSGGEKQRVLLARALMGKPDLLVLDEPMQGVDVQGQNQLYHLIQNVKLQDGPAIVLVSHDLHLVLAVSDQVLCLNKHICCVGKPESVVKDPSYQKLFMPPQAEHLAFYEHHHDHAHDPCSAGKEKEKDE